MEYLILGNGFDLAHDLQTQYSDYLKITSLVRRYTFVWKEGRADLFKHSYERSEDEAVLQYCNTIGQHLATEFIKITTESFWIQYFLNRGTKIGLKWIDFEREIEEVIGLLISYYEKRPLDNIIIDVPIVELKEFLAQSNKIGRISQKELFQLIYDDYYNRLIRSLEIYMGAFVDKCKCNKSFSLFMKNYDGVLSFNYTDTYCRVYNKDSEICCHIHGKADHFKKDLVMGYEEKESTSKISWEGIPYQKYYQRIVNDTDNRYYSWVPKTDSYTSTPNNVYIYGHSLSPMDGDIIRSFVVPHLSHTYIYYVDEKDRAEKIRNLPIILGPDVLNERAGGPRKHIIFRNVDILSHI